MTEKQHYMTKEERYKLEALLEAKIPKSRIAKQLGFCRQTIYNEIERGAYIHVREHAVQLHRKVGVPAPDEPRPVGEGKEEEAELPARPANFSPEAAIHYREAGDHQ